MPWGEGEAKEGGGVGARYLDSSLTKDEADAGGMKVGKRHPSRACMGGGGCAPQLRPCMEECCQRGPPPH